jgi:hypothetical protein
MGPSLPAAPENTAATGISGPSGAERAEIPYPASVPGRPERGRTPSTQLGPSGSECCPTFVTTNPANRTDFRKELMAVEVGFEPTEVLPPHTLSRRARSATTRLHRDGAYR